MSPHLTDVELQAVITGAATPDVLLRADDHLAGCESCRRRAAQLGRASQRIDDVTDDLSTDTRHLSDDDLQAFVRDALPAPARDAAAAHLTSCPTCARQIEDLRAWTAPVSRPSRRVNWRAVAAAVLLVAAAAAVTWQVRASRHAPPVLAGLDRLSARDQALMTAALEDGGASLPAFMRDVSPPKEVLMGANAGNGEAFRLLSPVATGVASDRPAFTWQPLSGATTYVVTVFDEQTNVIARSGELGGTSWTTDAPLPRDRTYVWQVVATRGADRVTSPIAPAPPAKFRVIDATSAETLARLEREAPQAHVLLGMLNMSAGIRAAAIAHFEQVPASDPHADLARRSLARLGSQ